jgi:pyruvate kinase
MGLTPVLSTARRLALSFGVHAVHTEDAQNFKDMVVKAVAIAKRERLAKAGDKVVITAGVPFGTPGSTNILRIAEIPET